MRGTLWSISDHTDTSLATAHCLDRMMGIAIRVDVAAMAYGWLDYADNLRTALQ